MKLVRYGDAGAEKPGMLDADGNLRDLSAHVDDITGDVLSEAGLNKLREIEPGDLPVIAGRTAHRAMCRQHRQIHVHWSELCGPCRRDRESFS